MASTVPRRDSSPSAVRASLLFFGLDRSSTWTWDSIEQNVIVPCSGALQDVRIYCRFNAVDRIDNPRSLEVSIERKPSEFARRRQDMDSYQEDDQDTLDIGVVYEAMKGCTDIYEDDFRSYRNLAHVFTNQKRLWQDVLQAGGGDADLFLILRPDLVYLDPLPLEDICRQILNDGHDLLVPGWHRYGGLNDRLAAANRRGAEAYLTRIDRVLEFIGHAGSVQSEKFLAWTAQQAGLDVGTLDVLAARVRSYGKVYTPDQKMLQKIGRRAVLGRIEPPVKADPDTLKPKGGSTRSNTVFRVQEMFGELPIGRYLEIGVQNGHTFLQIEARTKIAVDPKFLFVTAPHQSKQVEFHALTSDDYFRRPWDGERFDLAFIDGLHTFEQTLRDLCNVLSRVHAGSILLIDDTVPSDVYSALPAQKRAMAARKFGGGQGAAWHGDVYKVVLFLHDFLPTLSYMTIMTGGNPQTVAWFEPRASFQPKYGSLEAISRVSYFDLVDHFEIMNPVEEEFAIWKIRNFLKLSGNAG